MTYATTDEQHLARSYVILAIGMTLCLLGGPTAYWLRGAIATGWRQALGVVGRRW